MADVFLICPRATQSVLIKDLAEDLEAAGISVWWDATPLTPAQDKIDLEFASAKAVVAVWNAESANSPGSWTAVKEAARHQKLVNVRVPDLDSTLVPRLFHNGHLIDLDDRSAIIKALEKLGISKNALVKQEEPTPQQPAEAPDRQQAVFSQDRRQEVGDGQEQNPSQEYAQRGEAPPIEVHIPITSGEEDEEETSEREAFEAAKRENSFGAFCTFLAMYPDGAHAADARMLSRPLSAAEVGNHLTIINDEPPPIAPTFPSEPPPAQVQSSQSGGRGLLVAAAIVAAIALSGTIAFSIYQSADARMARAEDYYAKGEFNNAITEYSEAIRGYVSRPGNEPKLIQAYHKRARTRIALGYTDSAISDLGEALRLDPRNDRLFFERGDLYRAREDIERAATDYRRAVQLSLYYDDMLVKAADDLRKNGRRPESLLFNRINVIVFDGLARTEPYNQRWRQNLESTAHSLGNLSWNMILNGDFVRALEAADRGIAVTPQQLWMHTNRAHALMFLGRVQEARSLYRLYRNERRVQGDKSWPTVIKEDFVHIRNAGFSHPLMDEIQRLFRNL
jgi:tetratricopeptide (TPR) repeat protein